MPASSSFATLLQHIEFCQLSKYQISFWARQTFPSSQHCVIEIGWLDSNYYTLQTPQLTSTWTFYGPATFESTAVGTGVGQNSNGSFNANLQISVSCYGVKGVAPPAKVQVAVDSIMIDPAK